LIKKEAALPEPIVGLMQPNQLPPMNLKPSDLTICDLDYQIINSLKDDARKAIADIANELGISSKTVRRRLNRMIKNNLIELTLEWYPDKSDDITTLMDIRLKPDSNLAMVAYQILKEYVKNALFYWSFATYPMP
jgi:hypothetical protein